MPHIASYAKGRATREELLQVALSVFSRDEYGTATLADIAKEAGVTRSTLLYHFKSKEELFAAVIRWRDELNRELLSLDDGMVEGFVRLARHNESVPGVVRLFASLSAEATSGEHAAHQYFSERYRSLIESLSEEIQKQQRGGSVTGSIDPVTLARVYIALLDGMQLQWLYDPSADMSAAVDAVRKLMAEAPAPGK